MGKTKEYAKNTIILFVGKFSTQFMSLLLLPLYTYCLDVADYGLVDVVQTYISLFIPILTLRFDSAAFRFLIDARNKEYKKREIISNVIIALIAQIIVFIAIYLVIGIFIKFSYFWLIMLNIAILMASNILLQLARGLGKNKDYAIACILTSAITLITNFILIYIKKQNAGSILIASIFANFICAGYLLWKTNVFKFIKLKLVNKKTLKEIAKYSIPMVPNSLSWWIMNVSDRTIITYIIGTAANGIYTVSCKFSNILNSVFSVFNMSWQEMVSLHINDEDSSTFFSDMINKILKLFISISILIISVLPVVYNIIIGEQYLDSYIYIPILLFANIFNVAINLIGGLYVGLKMTKKIANTTIISAVINVIINIALMNKIGLYAACISTVVAYVITTIYRYYDIKKYVDIKLFYNDLVTSMIIYVIVAVIYYYNNTILSLIGIILSVVYFIMTNKYILKIFFDMIKSKKKNKY